jgi:hypothetical protein
MTSAMWNNGKRYNRTFDANHNPITETTQQWNNSGWGNMQRQTMTYDMHNNLTATVTETWNTAANGWVYDASSVNKHYYYGVYYPVKVQMINNAPQPSFALYPNPCTDVFTIAITSQGFEKGMVMVYDAMGRVVYANPQISTSQIQISLHQPKGIYWVKLQLDGAVSTKQLAVE